MGVTLEKLNRISCPVSSVYTNDNFYNPAFLEWRHCTCVRVQTTLLICGR